MIIQNRVSLFGKPKSDNSLAHFGEAQNIREQGDFPLTPFLDK
jgi:hypothetical protein